MTSMFSLLGGASLSNTAFTSAPHIFADSTSSLASTITSTVSSVSTSGSRSPAAYEGYNEGRENDEEDSNQSGTGSCANSYSPHMFLSYADPNNNGVLRERIKQTNQNDPPAQYFNCSAVLGTTPPRNFSAHQFLNYANDECIQSSPKSNSKQIKQTTTISAAEERSPHPRDSGTQAMHQLQHDVLGNHVQRFRQECSKGLEAKCGLSSPHATTAAMAFLRAAEAAAAGHPPGSFDKHFSFCQAIVVRTMCEQGGNSTYPNQEHNFASDNRDMSNLDSSTTRQSQQAEIQFLRLAVKHLVLQLGSSVPPKEPELDLPTRLYGRECQQKGVPDKVEFYAPSAADEPASELSEDDSLDLGLALPPSSLPRNVGCSLGYNLSPLLPWGLDTRKASLSVTAQNYYLETVKLLLSCKAKSQQPAKILLLEQGEVRPDRARGMKVQLFLRSASFSGRVQGRYNGSLTKGVPNGSGVLRFENRDLYIGEFLNGFMHGEGTLFCRSNSTRKLEVLRGQFQYNEFLGGIQSSNTEDTISAGAA